MTTLVLGLAGACLGLAVLATAFAVRPDLLPTPRVWDPRRRWRQSRVQPGWAAWRWPAAVLVGLVVVAASRWLVAGVLVAAAVVGLPAIFTTSQTAAARIDRVEAIEEWTRRLADLLRSGVGLDQALVSSASTAPERLQPQIQALAARLLARWSTRDALIALADDIDDAAGDLVVAAMLLASERRGPGLATALAAAADSVAAEVASRRAVEAERAKPRTTARAVTLITLGVVAVGSLNGEYLAPYREPLGQLVLILLASGFAACLWWIRTLTLAAPTPRALSGAATGRDGEVSR
ncbi:type II secretion system F family protein [Actinotalea sp. K2]|uniref:type II secretion system F family protein n=1 Tax=Actinotalea sp. K2 TaxID=2939438 RepID=UPI002016C0D6|nr:type II secretion system F family protein [Actinotalea sp. K2]MCL3862058.1 type II secretion system F family protein [Actinotalea sp. K2]